MLKMIIMEHINLVYMYICTNFETSHVSRSRNTSKHHLNSTKKHIPSNKIKMVSYAVEIVSSDGTARSLEE